MNKYLKNLNRIEFVVTYACTGRCKHCSEGGHLGGGVHIDASAAAAAVREVAGKYKITSVMTFGGEPLLYPEVVLAIHKAAAEMNIEKRQIITNGYFTKDPETIRDTAKKMYDAGVNDVLLSADAFHQETIPITPVKSFASALRENGVPVRVHPAWLVSETDENPYNLRTKEVLSEFSEMGIKVSEGNIIFPSGNAKKYLSEYFKNETEAKNPYEEDPFDVRAISFDPDGGLFSGNIYEKSVSEILREYRPE